MSRNAEVKSTGGLPTVEFEGTSNPCNDDQSIDLLLSLQWLGFGGLHCRSRRALPSTMQRRATPLWR